MSIVFGKQIKNIFNHVVQMILWSKTVSLIRYLTEQINLSLSHVLIPFYLFFHQ